MPLKRMGGRLCSLQERMSERCDGCERLMRAQVSSFDFTRCLCFEEVVFEDLDPDVTRRMA
jgi:hypothetical protein